MAAKLSAVIHVQAVRSSVLNEGFAETVLHNRLVKGIVEFRVHDVPCAVINKADHVGRLSTHVDAILDVCLPEVVPPGLLETPCRGDIAGVCLHLAAGVPTRRKLVLQCTLFQKSGFCKPLPFQDVNDLIDTPPGNFTAELDGFLDKTVRDSAFTRRGRSLWLKAFKAVCPIACDPAPQCPLADLKFTCCIRLQFLVSGMIDGRIQKWCDDLHAISCDFFYPLFFHSDRTSLQISGSILSYALWTIIAERVCSPSSGVCHFADKVRQPSG